MCKLDQKNQTGLGKKCVYSLTDNIMRYSPPEGAKKLLLKILVTLLSVFSNFLE